MKIPVFVLGALVLSAPLAPAQEKPRARLYYIPSGSMEPTLKINDRVWGTPLPYQKSQPKRGDIAIVELKTAEVAPWSDDNSKTITMVKRVVAVPGDRVEIVKNVLKLNGKIQKESFVKWDGGYQYDMKVVGGQVYSREYDMQGQAGAWTRRSELVADEKRQRAISRAKTEALPSHKYLVLGDHRSNSNDSHVFGLIDRATFEAKITMRIYPYPRSF